MHSKKQKDYEKYKKICRESENHQCLVNVLEMNKQQLDAHLKDVIKMKDKADKCVKQRQEFQKKYIPLEDRDSGHYQAIEYTQGISKLCDRQLQRIAIRFEELQQIISPLSKRSSRSSRSSRTSRTPVTSPPRISPPSLVIQESKTKKKKKTKKSQEDIDFLIESIKSMDIDPYLELYNLVSKLLEPRFCGSDPLSEKEFSITVHHRVLSDYLEKHNTLKNLTSYAKKYIENQNLRLKLDTVSIGNFDNLQAIYVYVTIKYNELSYKVAIEKNLLLSDLISILLGNELFFEVNHKGRELNIYSSMTKFKNDDVITIALPVNISAEDKIERDEIIRELFAPYAHSTSHHVFDSKE